MKEFKINNLKNIPLNILEGQDINNPESIIINIHGITSHFQEIFYCEDSLVFKDDKFISKNYKTFGLEFHGHGKSGGIVCSIDSFDDLVDDLLCLVKHIDARFPNIPRFIIAESMGGAVSIKYNIKYQFKYPIKGYILMSPMCGIDDSLKPNIFAIHLLLTLSKFIPTYAALGTNSKMRESSRNKKYSELKNNCKYNYNGKMRLNTARECYNTSLWIKEYGKLFNAPLFLLHGIEDTITNPQLSIEFYKKVPNKLKNIYLPKNTDHCLFIGLHEEDDHPKIVLNKVLEWINKILNTN